jgi:hypothetical protein
MTNKPYRQGDVYLIPIGILPEGATKKDGVLIRGETTGHSHRIEGGDVYIKDGTQYVVAMQKTRLVHEEHKEHQLKKGVYEVRQKREYAPLSNRKVSD